MMTLIVDALLNFVTQIGRQSDRKSVALLFGSHFPWPGPRLLCPGIDLPGLQGYE